MKPVPTALLLGAGFSLDMGMPTVAELTREMRLHATPEKFRKMNAAQRTIGTGFPDEAFQSFFPVLTDKRRHYEQVMEWLQTTYMTNGVQYPAAFYNAYSWLVGLIWQLLYFRHEENETFFKRSLPFYRGLRALAEQQAPLWVFSLNHDICVEMFAGEFGISCSSGLGNELIALPRTDAGGNNIGAQQFRKIQRSNLKMLGENYLQPGAIGINLLKVHGSLDLFRQDEKPEPTFLQIVPSTDGIDGWLHALRSTNTELRYFYRGKEMMLSADITYADDGGEMRFLHRSLMAGGYKFEENERFAVNAPREFFDFFSNQLLLFDRLVAIGYGFGDAHINSAIAYWMRSSLGRRLTIVDPFRQEIPPTLTKFDGRIDIISMGATEYLDSVSGNVISPSDRRLRRHRRWLRTSRGERVGLFAKSMINLWRRQVRERLQRLERKTRR